MALITRREKGVGGGIEEDVCVRELQVVYTWSNLFEQS